jgi:hypothetical protein
MSCKALQLLYVIVFVYERTTDRRPGSQSVKFYIRRRPNMLMISIVSAQSLAADTSAGNVKSSWPSGSEHLSGARLQAITCLLSVPIVILHTLSRQHIASTTAH